jgi:hypothetical protein
MLANWMVACRTSPLASSHEDGASLSEGAVSRTGARPFPYTYSLVKARRG